METVKLIVEIPEKTLEDMKTLSSYGYNSMFNGLVEVISNGIPLPKGCGRVIDESKITKCEQVGLIIKDGSVTRCLITDAPTIIEADKKNTKNR